MKIVFMGTPQFAVRSLQALLEHGIAVQAVVTVPDKPAGRGLHLHPSEAKKFALEQGLPVLQPEVLTDPDFQQALQQHHADLFVVVAFRILPKSLLAIPRLGAINVHASLLPKYRGAAPIQCAIIRGERETGVTTFLIDEKIDTGRILLQEKIEIGENESAGELHDRLAELGAQVLIRTLTGVMKGELTPHEQHGEVTLAPKITKEMAEIDWNLPATRLRDLIRGLDPHPGAHTHWNGKLLKIWKGHVHDSENSTAAPGQVIHVDGRSGELWVGTGQGLLAIDEVQLQGKRRMTTAEFLPGHAMSENETLRHA